MGAGDGGFLPTGGVANSVLLRCGLIDCVHAACRSARHGVPALQRRDQLHSVARVSEVTCRSTSVDTSDTLNPNEVSEHGLGVPRVRCREAARSVGSRCWSRAAPGPLQLTQDRAPAARGLAFRMLAGSLAHAVPPRKAAQRRKPPQRHEQRRPCGRRDTKRSATGATAEPLRALRLNATCRHRSSTLQAHFTRQVAANPGDLARSAGTSRAVRFQSPRRAVPRGRARLPRLD